MNIIEPSPFDLKAYEAQARLFKALTHPARLAILDLLRGGEQCVCHLEAHLGYRQAYISQQLMLLREAGLVEDRRDGWNVFYHVSEPVVFALLAAVAQAPGLATAPAQPREPAACPCAKCARDGEGGSENLRRNLMLTVKVLGSGCANCKMLEALARQAIAGLGVEADVIKVTGYDDIMKYPIVSTPGLVINEKLVSAGRIPSQAEISAWLQEASA